MIIPLWILATITLLVLFDIWCKKKAKFAEGLPRGKSYYPLVGNLSKVFGKSTSKIFGVLHDWFRQHDRMFVLQSGPVVAVCLTHPELIGKVLNHPDCQEKPLPYKVVRLPNGLLSAKYNIWKLHRKTLNSTFNVKILNSFLPIFNTSGRKMIERLGRLADEGKSCNILEYISECTLEMICNTSLGSKAMEDNRKHEFIDNLKMYLDRKRVQDT